MRFVLFMAPIKHLEAFFTISDKLHVYHLPAALMPKSQDLAIFVITDNRNTKPITLPLTHNNIHTG